MNKITAEELNENPFKLIDKDWMLITAEKEGYAIVYNDVFKYTTPRLMAEHLTGTSTETETGSSTAAVSADDIYQRYSGPRFFRIFKVLFL